MLHLVRSSGDGIRSPGRRLSPLVPILTAEEAGRVKAALRSLRHKHGGWKPLAALMGCREQFLTRAASKRGRPTPGHALAVARVAGLPVEALLSGLAAAPAPPPAVERGGAA